MYRLGQNTINGLRDYIKARLDKGDRPKICGSNGGDGVHYNLTVGGGAWGAGEIYLRWTNHGYCDKPSEFNPYNDSISVGVY